MMAIEARSPAPSGVRGRTLDIRWVCMVMKYLSTRLFPVARMSVTVAVGCPSELTVADGLPPTFLTLTRNVASKACIDIVTSQSPTNGAIWAGVGADAAP